MSEEQGQQGQGDQQGGEQAGTDQTSMADIAATVQVSEKSDGAAQQGQQAQQSQQGQQGQEGNANHQEMQDFIASQSKTIESMKAQLEETSSAVTELASREQQVELNKAVDHAVEKINDGVDGNPDLADTFLNSQYQKNPDLRKIFDNRASNPQAWDKALGLLAAEWKAMNQRVIDPQVAENQRALSESQRQGSQVLVNQSADDRLANMGDGDFLREMQQLARAN